MRESTTALLALVMVTLPAASLGDPVTWELENVIFDGGGTANGSFTVDVDTGLFSNVLISTTVGTLPGDTYSGEIFDTIYSGGSLQFVRFSSVSGDLTNAFTFSLFFLQPLTNSGGVSALLESESAEVACTNADCSIVSNGRFIEADGLVRSVSQIEIISIDIKPGDFPNCFNLNGHGVIPVAILGTDSLDVAHIDQYSLRFGGLAVRVRGNKGPLCSFEDSNSDGIYDLICHFEDNADYWEAGEDDATLTGVLLDGTQIEGSDTICIVP